MATITLKDIPGPLHRALKKQARANHRSLNRETIDCLERVLLGQRESAQAFLERVRRHRNATPGQLTDELLHEALHTGRA
ncbi:MAG: DNA-binding protein [Verrucomicrobiota bacterium]